MKHLPGAELAELAGRDSGANLADEGMEAVHEWRPVDPPGLAVRSFAFDPSGSFLLLADRPANVVRSYQVDGATGALTPLTRVAPRRRSARWRHVHYTGAVR
jgi:hypothetical protein